MADGFIIPIEGDADPFRQALEQLRAAMNQLTAVMRQQAQSANQAGQAGVSSMDRFLQRASAVGNAVGGVSMALTTAVKIGRTLGRIRMADGVRQAVAGSTALRGGVSQVGAAMRAVMRSRTWRVIAVGAAAAVVSVLAVRTAWRAVSTAARLAGGVIRGVIRGAQGGLRGLRAGLSGIGSALRGLGSMFTAALPITGLVSLIGLMTSFGLVTKQSLSSAADFEALRVRVEQFTGSVEAARDLFRELDEFEVKTPFEGVNIRNTAAGLLGAGVQEDVAAITRELGALAKDGQQLEELGDAIGKGFANGKFQMEDIRKFTERQINLMPELAAVTGKTGEALRKAISEGLTFDQVRQAIQRMSAEGGQFFGLLERQSLTSKGLMSTLASGFDLLKREFGQPINDAIKPILKEAIGLVGQMREKVRAAGEAVGKALQVIFAAFKTGRLGELLGAGLRVAISGALDMLMRGLRGAVAFLAVTVPKVFELAASKLTDPVFWKGLGLLFKSIGLEISAAIKNATGRQGEAESESLLAKDLAFLGGKRIARAGQGEDIGAVLAAALRDGGLAFLEELRKGGADLGGDRARANLSRIVSELEPMMRQLREGAVVPGPAGQGRNPGPMPEDGEPGGDRPAGPASVTFATSMARIGGGGVGFTAFAPLHAESRKQTGLQKLMEKHLKKIADKEPGGAVFA